MPDLHSPSDLDRAFEALTSDLTARAGRPGPAAAMATARRRRRTAVAAVAAASVLAVGAVLVPQLAPERFGLVADLPGAAPLDESALEDATAGWISGWAEDQPAGSFSAPACVTSPQLVPQEESLGRSTFAASTYSGAMVRMGGYGSAGEARAVYDAWAATLGRCDQATGTDVGDYPDGTFVRHYRVEVTEGEGPGAALTDIWVAATGDDLGVIEVVTDGEPADSDSVEDVADALVAGLRSGWTQEPLDVPVAHPELGPRLPSYDQRGLVAALDGWRPVRSMDAFGTPPTPCLVPLRDGDESASGGVPTRAKIAMTHYEKADGRAAEEAGRVIDRLAGCRSTPVAAESLPGDVTLLTYDRGGDAGHGAVWVAATSDVAMVVTVDGAATAVPHGAAEAAGAWVREVLEQPSPGDG